MIHKIVTFLSEVVIPWGAPGVFLATIIEEALAPIPSPFIQMGAGFFFLKGDIDIAWVLTLLFTIIIPVALGVAIGSLVVYGATYYAGKPVLVRWGRWLGVSWGDVERLQKRWQGTYADELVLFILRTIPIMPSSVVSAFFGLTRFPLWKYMIITFAGTCVRAGVLAIVGWQVGEAYLAYADVVEQFESYALIGVGVCVVVFLAYRLINVRRRAQEV